MLQVFCCCCCFRGVHVAENLSHHQFPLAQTDTWGCHVVGMPEAVIPMPCSQSDRGSVLIDQFWSRQWERWRLWTRKVLCGSFLCAIYKFSFIHSFTQRSNSLTLWSEKVNTYHFHLSLWSHFYKCLVGCWIGLVKGGFVGRQFVGMLGNWMFSKWHVAELSVQCSLWEKMTLESS